MTGSMHDQPDLQRLGAFIRERRTALQLTQEQLAKRLDWTQERISVLERGKYGLPSLLALVHMAEALEVPLDALIEATGFAGVTRSLPAEGTPAGDLTLRYALQRLLAIDALTLHDALDQASDLLVQTMGADKIDAFLYESASESLVAVGTSNTPMGRRQHELGLHREPLANAGRTVQVYRTGESYYTPHADEDPEMVRGVVEGLGVRSFLAVPLRPNGRVMGVLAAESAHPDRFTEEERHFFEAAARWVAMVAQRTELSQSLTHVAVQDARRLAAEELVSLLAHDLDNALTPIQGRLDMLVRRFAREGRDRDRGDVDAVAHTMRQLHRMVTELLDVARIDAGIFAVSPQLVDLVAVIEEAVGPFQLTHPAMTLRLPDELPVHADPGRMAQVIQNLVSNAVTHSPDGVPIVIGAGIERRDDRTWAVVSVHDDGPGIPREQLPHLFTRFATGSGSPGLGIGLYLAHQITEAHGGTITVDSAPGKGSSFWLSLPLSEETSPIHPGD
jgi:signal transduction histidine kinase/transcriptional regulator with XRE-family HTH domain